MPGSGHRAPGVGARRAAARDGRRNAGRGARHRRGRRLAGGAGPRAGALIYNAVHTMVGPLALLGGGWWLGGGQSAAVAVALVWLAHIGLDRMVGYGLRYPDSKQRTHFDPL